MIGGFLMLNHAMRYVIIIIGCLLTAAAYNLFLIPMNFLSGGFYILLIVILADCIFLIQF